MSKEFLPKFDLIVLTILVVNDFKVVVLTANGEKSSIVSIIKKNQNFTQ
jgi:hypothetical protein